MRREEIRLVIQNVQILHFYPSLLWSVSCIALRRLIFLSLDSCRRRRLSLGVAASARTLLSIVPTFHKVLSFILIWGVFAETMVWRRARGCDGRTCHSRGASKGAKGAVREYFRSLDAAEDGTVSLRTTSRLLKLFSPDSEFSATFDTNKLLPILVC